MFSRVVINIVKRFLNRRGFAIVRINRLESILNELHKRNGHLTFLQIGANDGISFDGLFDFVARRRCRGVVVEPVALYFENLRENYRNYSHIVPLRCAVHADLPFATVYHGLLAVSNGFGQGELPVHEVDHGDEVAG